MSLSVDEWIKVAELIRPKHILIRRLIKQHYWKCEAFFSSPSLGLCIVAGSDSSPLPPRLPIGWERGSVFTAFTWMEMTCLLIVAGRRHVRIRRSCCIVKTNIKTELLFFVCVRNRERGDVRRAGSPLIIVLLWPRPSEGHQPSFDLSMIPCDSWMLGWSGLFRHRSRCLAYFLSRGRLFEMKAAVCVFVLLRCSVNGHSVMTEAVWKTSGPPGSMGGGNERDTLECKCLCK